MRERRFHQTSGTSVSGTNSARSTPTFSRGDDSPNAIRGGGTHFWGGRAPVGAAIAICLREAATATNTILHVLLINSPILQRRSAIAVTPSAKQCRHVTHARAA